MTELSLKLSAYLDGELDPAEAEALEQRLATDAEARAELDALIGVNTVAEEHFAAQLNEPVPIALAQAIKSAPMPGVAGGAPKSAPISAPMPANKPSRPVWGAVAASLVALMVGGAGGYFLKDQITPPVQTTGWLADVADYHAVYAGQQRHLVEVGADEKDHIEKWLGKTVGAEFSVPDLSQFGLTFEGGRLLVANAKPVAQLMYRNAEGDVIALCLQRSSKAPQPTVTFNQKTINGFDFVSWTANGADYVVIGPGGQPDLASIAETASTEI